MASSVTWAGADRMNRRLAAITAAMKPGSRQARQAADDFEKALYRDNAYKLSNSLDRKERPLAPLAASTLKNKKRRGGGPLYPGNGGSFARKFVVERTSFTGTTVIKLQARYDFPHAKYLIEGRPKGSNPKRPNWSLPPRDVGGPTLRCRQELRQIAAEYARAVAKAGT